MTIENPFITESVTITKLDAARRQLTTALRLWFADGDAVSILSLAYASHEIIHRLYRKRGLHGLLYDSTVIKDEHRKRFAKFIGEAPNFFKHAQKEDEHETIEFAPSMGDLLMMMSIIGLQRMEIELNDLENVFLFWIGIHFPDETLSENLASQGIPINKAREALSTLSRAEFFEAVRGRNKGELYRV